MGGGDDIQSAIASAVLAVVAGSSIGRSRSYGWTHPLMHVNLTVHGIIGFIHYQNSLFQIDTSQIFPISLAAAKYLSLAGLNSDIYRVWHSNKLIPIAFVVSGAVPLFLEISGQKNDNLGRIVMVGNIAALAWFALKKNSEWAWYTVGCSVVALLAAPLAAANMKALFPLAAAGMDYCAHGLFVVF